MARTQLQRRHCENPAAGAEIKHRFASSNDLLQPLNEQLRRRMVSGAECLLRIDDQLYLAGSEINLMP
jgi:hypothetical protein